jgi:hypothetical protein
MGLRLLSTASNRPSACFGTVNSSLRLSSIFRIIPDFKNAVNKEIQDISIHLT